MKKIYVLLLVLAVTSAAWAGYIDTDGYYVLDANQLSGFNNANGGGATLTINDSNGTISGIQSASSSWWMSFAATNLGKLPTSLSGATGWKLEFTNTGAGSLQLILIVSTAANGWQQGSGVWVSPGATGTVHIDINGPGQMNNYYITASVPADYDVLTFKAVTSPITIPQNATVNVDASSYIRTIPMTLYGANLASWDGSMGGGNTTFNNLVKASGCKYFRIPGGSWSNGHLWSDIEGPSGSQGWKVSYAEYLNLMTLISQPGEEVHPTFQPIVNFPGWWYEQCQDNNPTDDVCDWAQAHPNAVNAAAGWVQDQTARPVCAQYWEIGNEIGGPWEVGYFPEISGTYYGDYFADFYLGMKAVNPNIKIGACCRTGTQASGVSLVSGLLGP